MSYWYKKVDCHEYVVALNTEYNVSVHENDLMVWEAEDKAYDIIDELMKKYDVEEYDIYTQMEMNALYSGYIIKVKVNMVVPAVARNYDEALDVAESYVDNFTLPEGVAGISIGTWDAELREDKGHLMRCKGA